MKTKGIYSYAAQRVHELKEADTLIVDAKRDVQEGVKNEIYSLGYSYEELADRHAAFVAAVELNDGGFRALKRGEGKYINYELCKDSRSFQMLVANKDVDIESDMAIKQMILAVEKENCEHVEGQQVLDMDNPGEYLEVKSLEETLTEMFGQ